jgi:hypothetical protein
VDPRHGPRCTRWRRHRDAGSGRVAIRPRFGGGYVDLAIELGVDPARINTISDFEAAQRFVP